MPWLLILNEGDLSIGYIAIFYQGENLKLGNLDFMTYNFVVFSKVLELDETVQMVL